jgi:hypothetical protein
MNWATFGATFPQTHLDTLATTALFKNISAVLTIFQPSLLVSAFVYIFQQLGYIFRTKSILTAFWRNNSIQIHSPNLIVYVCTIGKLSCFLTLTSQPDSRETACHIPTSDFRQ